MRIALTHAFCWPEVRRGAERFIPGLAAALVRRGHEVTHFSSAWDAGREEVDGVTVVRIKRRHDDLYGHEAWFGRAVFPHLLRGTFDVVHSLGRHDALASIRAARLRRGRRTVFTDLGLPTRAYWRRLRRREGRTVEKVIDQIEVYSGMSQCALDHVVREYGRTDGVIVPGGVDIEVFRPAERREEKPTLLFSGAVDEPSKEVGLLLEAVALVAETEPDVQLWLSGPGDPAELLANAPNAARGRTRVLGLGEADRQHERYGRAWATCLPTRSDSFGMVLVESLACGTPLVTTTQGAPQELVNEGVTGSLCAPGDPQDLARACLASLALARRSATTTACRESARAFDWDRALAPLCERIYAGD